MNYTELALSSSSSSSSSPMSHKCLFVDTINLFTHIVNEGGRIIMFKDVSAFEA